MADEEAVRAAETTAISGAMLKYHHALGARPTAGKTVEHLSDDTIVYLSGKHVATYQWENPQHRFILKNSKTSEIVTFCVSANRKYIALAERLVEGSMQVNIYTQHTGSKVRALEFKYLSKRPVVTMSFSTDNKYLATVTAFPEVYIYLWQVDKARLIGMIDVPYEITRVTVSPWAYWTLCTTGPTSLKIWRLVDKQLKPTDVLPRRAKDATALGAAQATSFRFTCHCWFDEEKLVAGTEEGDLLVVENNETKKILRGIHGEGMAVTAVQCVARGIITGGDGGVVALLERTFDESTFFRVLRRIAVGHTSRVVDISVAPKEDNAVVFFQNNAMGLIALENIEMAKEAVTAVEGGAAVMTQATTPLTIGFHHDEITAVDVCVQKPIIATGSMDKTVRVWNYIRRRLEFSKQFDEEVLSLALHPTGLRMVVGFKSYMRMYNVLTNDLHFCYEFALKACSEVRFSNGGQAFAAVIAHRILIVNTYDFQCTAQLGGHMVLIRSLCWSANDLYITSADLNGVMYRWQIEKQTREELDEGRKNVSHTCVRVDDTTGLVASIGTCRVAEAGMAEGEIAIRCVTAGAQGPVRAVRPGFVAVKVPAQRKQHTAEMALSTLSQTLFVGAPTGALLLYRWPLQDDAQPYQTIDVHSSEILYVLLSRDERFLFTVGADRTMYMFDVDAVADGKSVNRKPFNYAAFEDVVYVLQSDMDEKAREAQMLQTELDELAAAKLRDEQALVHKYEVERATKEEEGQAQVGFLSRQLEQAMKQREDADRALSDNARQLEAMNMKAAEELEALYTKRSDEANTRYLQLKTERDDLVVRYENQLFKLQKEQEAERRRLEERLKETETRLGLEIEKLQATMRQNHEANNGMLDQCIIDYEQMVDEITLRHKQEMSKTEEDLARAINSGSTGERDSERLKKEKTSLNDQLKDREGNITELEQVVEKRKKENDSLRKEMYVRFESISTAEKKIQQLKKQTSELEKLRYVLTFKFNELKKEVAPKDKQIAFLTQRVEEMDHELEKVALDREGLKQALERKEDRLQVLHKEIRAQNQSLEDKERVVGALLRDLSDLVAQTDHKRLVHQLKDMVTRFGTKQSRVDTAAKEDRTAEFERQREYMESQLSCIRRQNTQKEGNMRQENQRGTAENAILVKEINELRHEKKQLGTKCAMVEQQLKEARVALQRATSAAIPSTASPSPSPGGMSSMGRDSATPTQGGGAGAASLDAGLPSRKGRLVRGPTRALRDVQQLDAEKIARIIAQVERNNSEMERQQDEIVRLRDFVGHLLARAERDRQLSSAEQQRHAEIRRHLDEAAEAERAVSRGSEGAAVDGM
jgi:WD40 repeat protein